MSTERELIQQQINIARKDAFIVADRLVDWYKKRIPADENPE